MVSLALRVRQAAKEDADMSGIDFDIAETPTGSDVLAEIGLDPGAVQDVIEDDRARSCPDRWSERGPWRGERKGAGEGGPRSLDVRRPSSLTRQGRRTS